MANYYCEPKTYPAYAATPANNTTAYDGDGLAKGLATPARVSIDLTAYTAAAGATVTVCGTLLTCVTSGAGAHQFNAGSGATLAANIASAIQAATNAVNAAATGWTTPQLRNAVYASSSTATLNIQTRAGSAVYNSNASWKVVSSGLTGGSQLDVTFANGASGAWGYWWNDYVDGILWPSAVARLAYGCAFTGNNLAPLAGPCNSITITDVVNVRGNNAVLYMGPVDTNSYLVTLTRPGVFLFDDGTEWSGDSGKTLTVNNRGTGSYNALYFAPTTTTERIVLVGRSLGCFQITGSSGGVWRIFNSGGGSTTLERILFVDGNSAFYFGWGSTTSEFVMQHCKLQVTRNGFYSPFGSVSLGNTPNSYLRVEDTVFDFNAYTGTPTYLFDLSPVSNRQVDIVFKGCTYVGAVPCYPFGNPSAIIGRATAENCYGFAPNQAVGIQGSNAAPMSPELGCYILQQGVGSAHQFRLETPANVIDWTAGKSYPTLNSYLPDGTAWPYMHSYTTTANAHRLAFGTEVVRLSKAVTLASKSTVTLELAIDTAVAASISKSHLGICVSYISASDSKVKNEYSLSSLVNMNDTTALATSSESWTVGGTYANWVARKIALTLANNIKQNTEIDVTLIAYKPAPGSNTAIFINPEVGLS